MPIYAYKAYSRAGQVESNNVSAQSLRHATELLNGKGLVAFEVSEQSTETKTTWRPRLSRLAAGSSLQELSSFLKELAMLLNAGLAIDQALKIMEDNNTSAQLKALNHGLIASLSEGSPLSDAFAKHAGNLPAYAIGLLRAGEIRGTLPEGLDEVASLIARQIKLQSGIRAALTYPLILGATAIAVLCIVVLYLLPALMPLFKDAGVPPPLSLQLAEGLRTFIGRFWHAILVVSVFAVFGLRAGANTERGRAVLQSLSLRIPFIGSIRRDLAIAGFSRTLGSLLRSGVAIVPALNAAAAATNNGLLSSAWKTASDAVREGSQLSAALQKSGQMTDLACRLIKVGESASKLDVMLLQLAGVLEEKTERQVDHAMALLTPLLTICIGVVVGGLILSVMQAVLSINDLAL